MIEQVLELLWDLSHLPALSTHLIEQALEEHLAILSDSYSVKETVKRQYVVKCVEDIKKVTKFVFFAPTENNEINQSLYIRCMNSIEVGKRSQTLCRCYIRDLKLFFI